MAYVSQEKKKALTPGIKKVLEKYKVKGSIGVRHHSTLVVKLKSGPFDFGSEYGINSYFPEHYDDAAPFIRELDAAMKGEEWFDKSDIQSDYFHVAHYVDIKVGTDTARYVQTS